MHASQEVAYTPIKRHAASTFTTAVSEQDRWFDRVRCCRVPKGRIVLLFCIIYSLVFTYILYTSSIWQGTSSLKATVVIWNRFSSTRTVKFVASPEVPYKNPFRQPARSSSPKKNSAVSNVFWPNGLNLSSKPVLLDLFGFFHAENIENVGFSSYNSRLLTYGGDSVCNHILEATYLNGRLKVFCVQPKAEPDERGYRAWCVCNPYEHSSMCRCRLRAVMLNMPNLFRQLLQTSSRAQDAIGLDSGDRRPYAYPFETNDIRCFPLSSLDVDMGHGFMRQMISDYSEYGLQADENSQGSGGRTRRIARLQNVCAESRGLQNSTKNGRNFPERRRVGLLVQAPLYAAHDSVAALNAALVLFMTLRDIFIDPQLNNGKDSRESKPIIIVSGSNHPSSVKFSLFDAFMLLLAGDFEVLDDADSDWESANRSRSMRGVRNANVFRALECLVVDDLIIVPSYLNSPLYRCLKPFPSVLLTEQCQMCSTFATPRIGKDEPVLSAYQRRAGDSAANQHGLAGAAGNMLAGFGSMVRDILSPNQPVAPQEEETAKVPQLGDEAKQFAGPIWAVKQQPAVASTTVTYFRRFILSACAQHKSMWPPPPSNGKNLMPKETQDTVASTARNIHIALMYESNQNRYDVTQLKEELLLKSFNNVSLIVKVVDVDAPHDDGDGKAKLCALASTLHHTDVLISYYHTPNLMHSIWLRSDAHVIALQPVGRLPHVTPYYDLLPNLIGFRYHAVQALKSTSDVNVQVGVHGFVGNFGELVSEVIKTIISAR